MQTILKFTIVIACGFLFMGGCATVQKWNIAHRPQIEQTAFAIGQVVAQDAMKAFVAGSNTNGAFSLAAGLQSLEGNYVSPAQITGLVGVWSPNTTAYNQIAATIAADLANNPPKTKNQVVARIEGYVAGLQGRPQPVPPIAR
jgi:hypothetical protein